MPSRIRANDPCDPGYPALPLPAAFAFTTGVTPCVNPASCRCHPIWSIRANKSLRCRPRKSWTPKRARTPSANAAVLTAARVSTLTSIASVAIAAAGTAAVAAVAAAIEYSANVGPGGARGLIWPGEVVDRALPDAGSRRRGAMRRPRGDVSAELDPQIAQICADLDALADGYCA